MIRINPNNIGVHVGAFRLGGLEALDQRTVDQDLGWLVEGGAVVYDPSSVGDATLISIREGQFDYVDVVGEHLIGNRKIASEGVVIAGRWWHPK